MRNRSPLSLILVLVLIAGTLGGYTLAGPLVEAQAEPLPFSVGDTVTLSYGQDAAHTPAGGSVECTVTEIRGAFIKCGPRNNRIDTSRAERWLTLKYVVQISKRLD